MNEDTSNGNSRNFYRLIRDTEAQKKDVNREIRKFDGTELQRWYPRMEPWKMHFREQFGAQLH